MMTLSTLLFAATLPMTEVPSSWALPTVMGKDFWTCICLCDRAEREIAGVTELPSIREAAIHYFCCPWRGLTDWKKAKDYPKSYLQPIPAAERRTTPYKVTDLTSNATALEKGLPKDRPFFLSYRELRPSFFLRRDGYPLADRADYAVWRAAHPNFVGLDALDEFDSDSSYFYRFYDTITDEGLKAAFPREEPDAGSRALDWGRTALANCRALFFGEKEISPMCSGQASFAHIFAALGATGLSYEATTQSYPSWQVAASYTRGAARQYGLPIRWYTANYYSGYSRDGTYLVGENRWRPKKINATGAHRGASRSLLRRQALHGWLVGSTYLQTEHWDWLYVAETNGVTCASPEALDYEEVYQFSKRIDRGVPITPLVVLTPITDPMFTSGFYRNARDRFTPAAIFHTLVPIGYRGSASMRKSGEQGCLFNSPFADFCDVVTPDAGQDTAALVKALAPYPYAILAGTGFQRERLDTVALETYVRNGGTLVVSADQIGLGYVTTNLCGVAFSDETVCASDTFVDRSNATFPLKDEYRIFKGTSLGAEILLSAAGVPLAYEYAAGKGRVITLACTKGLPARYADSPRMANDAYHKLFLEITATTRTFEVMRWILNRVQSETLPVTVSGKSQWGVNRTKKGYLVYVFNNQGVIKYCDEPESFDHTKTIKVELDARRLGNVRFSDAIMSHSLVGENGRLTLEIGPGDVRLVTIDL